MNRNWIYDPDMPIDAVMRRWPATMEVMMRHRMLCIGCPIGAFHTVNEACDEHGLDEQSLIGELAKAVAGQGN